ncbi:MAG: hypothetical protein A2Z15_03835 [Chloroflexi bacterium RBG_16_50_11]|nr:MAG: hypothetical protein A2Z15_03835 [Chloroflexi bacterium RBG_16_50_11]
MIKIPKRNKFDFPRKSRRIDYYIEVLCAEIMKKDEIGSEDIDNYQKEVNKIIKEKLRPNWQRENMKIAAEKGLSELLNNYKYDSTKNIYKKL